MKETEEGPHYRPAPEFRLAVRRISVRIIAAARAAARPLGYALAVHGSLERDVDLLAAPWAEDAAAPETLAEAIRAAIAVELAASWFNHDEATAQPNKPHGRSAYTLTGFGTVTTPNGAFPFVDLSIMPRRADD